MTPKHFVAKWKASQLREWQASQEQFIDLCRLHDEALLRPFELNQSRAAA